ncbi:hypothetical protein NQ314_017594 [Rhamnusium bicolor]|uniref:Retrotransposon gag domain-containing protein n=1 Tax=Rhamnusium bicolor TaxID=1586634 RepID=A0AAV8WTU3_9CUCU|nr:hypothetical protein NQ314_017594 [Rhamnusium bicolor]
MEYKYVELCAKLEQHFDPVTTIYRERDEFYGTSQSPGESIADFYAKIRSLAANCAFGQNLPSILVAKFVWLVKGPIKDRVMEEPVETSIERLLVISMSREATLKVDRTNVNYWVKTEGVSKNFGQTRSGYSKSLIPNVGRTSIPP